MGVGSSESSASLTEMEGYKNLCAALAVGSACLASGCGIGYFVKSQNEISLLERERVVSNSNNEGQTEPLLQRQQNGTSRDERMKTILALIFIEAIGLYGLIVGLILA